MDETPDKLELQSLADGYLADTLDAAGLARLEAILLADPAARQFLLAYAGFDRDLAMEVHARRQGNAALARIGIVDAEPVAPVRAISRSRFRPLRWLAVAAALAVAVGAGWSIAKSQQSPRQRIVVKDKPATNPTTNPTADVAWLVNAQNCRWADGVAPPDMRSGTVLKIDRGLAEVRFRSGAAVLLEGPARLELVGGNAARLHAGRLTGKVSGPIKGFEVLTPGGKVIDLGTEFGVVVAGSGQTDVYVFDGKVQAVGGDQKVVDLVGTQSARIAESGVTVRGSADGAPVEFVRQILPPPVVEPRSLRLNFGKGYEGTITDAQGMGTGLTHRLPGTGVGLADADPNLVVNSEDGRLELTTTQSDINRQENLPTGEYLGARLADLGFTGPEDFEVEMVVPNIPGLKNIGQFGLYAGAKSDRVIRGGLISRFNEPEEEGRYTLFMTNNDGGLDRDSHALGLFAMGDDVRVRLKRTDGKYAMTVENLATGGATTISIRHPSFLDAENDLYVGLFGANTGSSVRRTLWIKEFAVTVWTKGGDARRTTLAMR